MEDCYFRSKSACVKCESIAKTGAILAAVVVAAVVGIAFGFYLFNYRKAFYLKLRQTMNLISDSGTLKILLLYLQTTSSLNNIWPDWALRCARPALTFFFCWSTFSCFLLY